MKDKQRLRKIYQKTDGCCHICHRKLRLSNYGLYGETGAWQIEHSIPKSKGGTDHLNNLFPACIDCNYEKGTRNSRSMRARNGVARAPYSKSKKENIKNDNTIGGAAIGGGIGWAIAGPFGGIVGGIIGGAIGENNSPKR